MDDCIVATQGRPAGGVNDYGQQAAMCQLIDS